MTLDRMAARSGVFTTADARQMGYDGRAVARAVRRGDWHRVRRGAFVAAPSWAAATPEARHLAIAAAVARSHGDRVAFSHVTAALLHGVAVWGVDLSRVHVTRLDGGAGRVERDVVHHEATCLAEGDVVRLERPVGDVGPVLVTHPARAALETGLLASTESALVSLDSVLHLRLGTALEVGTAYDTIQRWPGSQHLQVACRMADGRAESAGETRARWLFFEEGLPAPQLQREVRDATGLLLGTTDFAWEEQRMLGEFDGRVKYEKLLRPGQRASDVVVAEKSREDDLRAATRFGMLRLVWHDLTPATRRGTAAYVRRRLAQG